MAEANLHPPQQTVHPSMRYEQKREPEDIHLSEPRPRRSSAASSFHSLASSSASHFHDESPDTSAEGQNSFLAQRAALAPTSNSEGFLVGFSPTLPPALVRWADLITLLLNPAATARLPSGHLIADMADSIAARLERDPGAYPFATSPTDEQHFASVAGQLTSSPPKTLYHAEPPSAPESELFYNPAQPRPHPLSSFPQFSTAQPPTHVPREPLPPPASTACVNPVYTVGYAEQAVSSPDEAVPVLPTPPAHLRNAAPPPPPQQQLLPPMDLNDPVSSRDFASPRMGLYGQEPGHSGYNELASISSRRGTLRQNSAAQSPYHRPAVIQTAHFSASSLHEYAGADSIQPEPSSMYYQHDEYDEPATAVPPGLMRSTNLRSASRGFKRRNFRPLNEEEETYYWSALLQTLTRIQPDPAGRTRTRPLGEIMVVFPPGSYCRVMVDDTEALPCDTRSRVNEWLRGQRCVEGCSFRFEGKRPSVIRQHVTACKARAQKLEVDPLKKLCQLQLEAQSQEVRTRQPSKLRRQSKAPRPDEDETMDRSSIFSYESYGSRCSSSAGGGNSPRPSWYSNELPGEIDDATMRLEGQEEDLVMPDSDKTPSLPPAPHAVWPQADNLAAELTATSSLVSMSRSLEGAYSSAPPGERLSTPLSAHLEVAASEAGSSFALA